METKTIHANTIDELKICWKCPYKKKVCQFPHHVWRNSGDKTNRVITGKSNIFCDGLKKDGYSSVNIVIDDNTKKRNTNILKKNWAVNF